MKKLLVVLVVLLAAASLPADPIQLGTFPLGQWLDATYNAVWDFASNNIRILSVDGKVLYDFSAKTIKDFKLIMEGTQPGISFTCPEAGRTYKFLKSLLGSDLTMEIERNSKPKYSVNMQKR